MLMVMVMVMVMVTMTVTVTLTVMVMVMVMVMVTPPHRAGVGREEEEDLALEQVCLAGFVNAEQFQISLLFKKKSWAT